MLKIIYLTLFVIFIGFCQLTSGNSDENSLLSTRSLLSKKDPINSNSIFKINTKLNSILSNIELKLFEQSFESLLNVKCQNDLNTTLSGIIEGLPWAIAMYDSSAKSSSGIESGSVYQMGNFDECIFINDNTGILEYPESKYCLVDVLTEGYQIRNKRIPQIRSTLLTHWGICIPASCGHQDIEKFLSNILDLEVHVDENKCYVKKPFELTRGMAIYGCIILCFLIMAIGCTLYHLKLIAYPNQPTKDSDTLEMILKSFSIIGNLQKLFQQSNDDLGLKSINGIKAILMFLILAGHTLLFVVGGPVLNSEFIQTEVKHFQNAFILNSVLFVDTFLLLSGFLFCRILLKELEKRNGKINVLLLYIFRYIRLTPAYLAVIGFYITWFPIIGSGPLWNQRIVVEQKRCEKSWWLNILYINNYFGTDNLCMFQSWYLSADTQLFILAPIVIYLLWKNRKCGLILLSGLIVFTSVLPVVLTYLQKLDPTLLNIDEIDDISANTFFLTSYIKTHMRATGYVFGLLTGFLLHYITEQAIKIPKKLVITFWILSTIIGLLSMFSVTLFYINGSFTIFESSLYAGLHRLGWSISTGWLIIASTTGNCGVLEKFLCSRFFVPLSRLTYCSYLTNGLVELYMAGTLRSPLYMNHINLMGYTISYACLTLIAAVFLCLLFESPIHCMERILLRNDKQKQTNQQINKHNTRIITNPNDENV